MLSLVLDVETTGLDPMRDRIVEVGFVLTDWKSEASELRSYVNPGYAFANEYNGLSTQDVKDAPSFAQLAPFVYLLLLQADEYIGHNIGFDNRFFREELARLGLPFPTRAQYDTCSACGRKKLHDACDLYGVKTDDLRFHTALDDAIASYRLAFAIRGAPGGRSQGVSEPLTLGPRFR